MNEHDSARMGESLLRAGWIPADAAESADLVLLNEHPVSYRDETQERLQHLLEDGPWRGWRDKPGGAYLSREGRVRALNVQNAVRYVRE